MSQKKRRSEDPGQGKKGSRRRAPAAGATERQAAERKTAERKTAERASEAAESPPKKLPAFGFADDLLGEEGGGAAASATAASAAAAADGDGATVAADDDPQRIFAFADGLETERRSEKPETIPRRLTSWVTFGLAGEVFALPVEPIREVLRVASITRVPHAPEPIRGVTNLRGRVIPVIDLRRRIELPAAELDRASRVIVVGSRGRLLGLLVDVVHQVLHIDLNQVQAPPEDVMTAQSDYVLGVYHHGDQLVLLFDVDRAMVIKGPTPETPPAAVRGTAEAERLEEGS